MPMSTPQYPHHNSHPDYSSLWVCNSISQLFMRLVTFMRVMRLTILVWVFTLCRVHWPCNCNTETRGTHDTPCQVRVSLRSGPAWELLDGKCYHNAASSPTHSHWRLQGRAGWTHLDLDVILFHLLHQTLFPPSLPSRQSDWSCPMLGRWLQGREPGLRRTVNTAPRHGRGPHSALRT